MRAEADEHGITGKAFTNELSHVHFAMKTHFRGAGITEVGIVRPNSGFRFAASIQMRHEIFKGLYHVLVPQVQGGRAPAEHRPVIFFRVLYQARVLLCEKNSSAATSPSRVENSAAFCCNSVSC